MIVYVETQVVVWLAEANLARISRKANSLINSGDVRISPTAVIRAAVSV
jgi:hypothetical protein